jgi:hypothetical protein
MVFLLGYLRPDVKLWGIGWSASEVAVLDWKDNITAPLGHLGMPSSTVTTTVHVGKDIFPCQIKPLPEVAFVTSVVR